MAKRSFKRFRFEHKGVVYSPFRLWYVLWRRLCGKKLTSKRKLLRYLGER